MVSFKLAAIKILKESKEPLHYEEITRRALENNLIETSGATPESTMNAQIASDIKHKNLNSAFIRTKPGCFSLNPNFTEKEEKEEEADEIIKEEELKENISTQYIGKAGEYLVVRASEFLNLKISSIKFLDSYAEVNVPDGKTGERVIYITRSVPLLLKYLDVHPTKNDPNTYLWLSEANHNRNEPLKHNGGQKLINRCFKEANVQKKHNYHWFRHSRATLLAPILTEAILCKYMGWAIGSKQVKTYLHLCNQQLADVFLKSQGIDNQIDENKKPFKCVCGTLNHPQEKYCQKCYRPLRSHDVLLEHELKDSDIAKDTNYFFKMIHELDTGTFATLVKIAQNPDLMAMLEKIKKE